MAAVVVGLLGSFGASAQMMDMKDFGATVGLRMWHTQWSTWFVTSSVPGAVLSPSQATTGFIYNSDADTKNTMIPVVTLRYKKWFVSASQLVAHDFPFPLTTTSGGQLQTDVFKRKEYDVSLGYQVVPGIAAFVGYKYLRYNGVSGPDVAYNYAAKGPIVGVSANAPINNWAALYGSFGYGRPKVTDYGGFIGEQNHGDYYVIDAGVAFPLAGMSPQLQGLVITAGYRAQRISSRNVNQSTFTISNGVGTLVGTRSADLKDITQGPVVGVTYTF